MSKLKETIFSEELKECYKVGEKDFTRKRKQSFVGTVLFILNRLTKTLSVEIDNFIKTLQGKHISIKSEFFTKSAFVQCRKKIKPEVFIHLSDSLIKEFYADNEDGVKRWHGHRLLAIDGTHLTLPNTKELQAEFGTAKNQSNVVLTQARASVLYDVLNGFALDSVLSPLNVSERRLALRHFDFAQKGDLIIFDRGYPSFDLIYELNQRNIDFLFRVKLGFNNQVKSFVESKKLTEIVKIYPPMNASLSSKMYSHKDYFLVRLSKVFLANGMTEVLMSSLLDFVKYDNRQFKDLYFMRWKVETYYDELKNKLQMMSFSGYSSESIYQDFYSTIFVSNIQTVLIGEINDELVNLKGQNKYRYKVNVNVSYGILKNRILELFFSDKPMQQIIKEIKELVKKHTVPVRLNRKFHRINGKYRRRTKPIVTKNQKNAF